EPGAGTNWQPSVKDQEVSPCGGGVVSVLEQLANDGPKALPFGIPVVKQLLEHVDDFRRSEDEVRHHSAQDWNGLVRQPYPGAVVSEARQQVGFPSSKGSIVVGV